MYFHLYLFFETSDQARTGSTSYGQRDLGRSNEVIPTELGKKLRHNCLKPCHLVMQAPGNTVPKEIHVSPNCIFPLGFEWRHDPVIQAGNFDIFLYITHSLIIASFLIRLRSVPSLFTHCCCPHPLSPGPL